MHFILLAESCHATNAFLEFNFTCNLSVSMLTTIIEPPRAHDIVGRDGNKVRGMRSNFSRMLLHQFHFA